MGQAMGMFVGFFVGDCVGLAAPGLVGVTSD